jgi:hypothetical protein
MAKSEGTPQKAPGPSPNAGDLAALVDAYFARFYPNAPEERRDHARRVVALLEAAIVLGGALERPMPSFSDLPPEFAEKHAESGRRARASNAALWDRIRDAAKRIAGTDRYGPLRAHVVETAEQVLAVPGGLAGPMPLLDWIRRRLAVADPAFAKLSDPEIVHAFDGARSAENAPKTPEGRVKGGRGHRGPVHVAVALSFACGAFGDTNKTRAAHDFASAVNKRTKP